MKLLLRSLLITCFSFLMYSLEAAGGPDAFGYTWLTSLDAGGPGYNWVDITGRSNVQTVSGLADDNASVGMLNIGFKFHYYWSDYSQLKVGSNGWVSFKNVSNIASCFPSIPAAGGPADNYLAPLMGDLNFTGAGNPGKVQYWSNDIDTFIISYIGVPFWSVSAPGWTGSNSFQIILSGRDSSITYQYGPLSGFLANAACIDLTVGIENSTGTIGLQVHSDAMPPNNYAIHFHYPDIILMSIQDAVPGWNANADNGAEFLIKNVSYPLKSNIRNSGNSDITSTINLLSQVKDPSLANVLTNTGSIPVLAAGDDSIYVFSNSWSPAIAGQYTNSTTISCSQDINAANNILNTELDVVDICNPEMLLSYVSGGAPGGSLNWNGGANDDGAAVYFKPPIFPYTIKSLQYYISSNVSNGYIAQVYKDGLNGSPATLLYSTTIQSSSVVSASWNTVNVTPAVTLDSGGFYVVWLQGGTNIFLGIENTGPRCYRNYEILDGAWARLRYDETQDVMIRANITDYIKLPVSGFTPVVNGQTGTFTNNSTGLVTSWLWDFGDSSTTSSLKDPIHTYDAAGTYNVRLISTDQCGMTDTNYKSINICFSPDANYSFSTNFLQADFTDLSSGTVFSWKWDFGDYTPSSSSQNPVHTYAEPGLYNINLIVGNNCGESDTIYQNVKVCSQQMTNFVHSDSLLTVTFTNQTTNSPVSWEWDFGDGQTSALQNPIHNYSASGNYTVCLISTNDCGYKDSVCSGITICEPLVPAFSFTQNEDSLFAEDLSTGNITTWNWDFGDGSPSSTLQNPVHKYPAAGTYTLSLTSKDNCEVRDSVNQSINICFHPDANFTISSDILETNFIDLSGGTVSSVLWDFGDGLTSTTRNPVHNYTAAGSYTACLKAMNDCGDIDTFCTVLNICDQLVTAFSYTLYEDTLFITNGSTGNIIGWFWDFGDGSPAVISQNTVHKYSSEGEYTVCLNATDVCGVSDSICQSVVINITGLDKNNSIISGVYPNPVNDHLNILFTSSIGKGTIEIIDQTGRLVILLQSVSGQKISLDVKKLLAGTYLLRVSNEKGSASTRFIKSIH